MNSYGKYWFLVVLLLFVSCADNLLVSSQYASPLLALGVSLLASLVGWAWLVKSLQKDSEQISACLRNPELLRPELKRKNFFGKLLAEAIEKIEESDTELLSTNQVKTMLKARLNTLAKKENLMESVLDQLPVGVLVFDAQHALEFSNRAAEQFVLPEVIHQQQTSDSSLALSQALSNDVVIPEIGNLLKKTIERKNATSSRRSEFELTGLDFQSQFRAVATNLFDDNRAMLGTVIVVENIGEENNEKERHAEFVSSVAHELKTPMAGIKAYIEMLLDGECEPDEAAELHGFINEQIDRLTRMVNSMLNLARIESGVVEIKRHDYELNDILKSAADVISPNAAEKDISFTSELSELYLPVHVDKDMLGQAIINLLSNAVKYTPHGHAVRLRSRMEDNTAVIEVRDTGMGIPENSLPHIFDRFYRVPENNRSAAGTGLGLALVHFIVTNVHNGSISVQSVVNEGTCFTVTIPLGHQEQKKKKQLASPVTV